MIFLCGLLSFIALTSTPTESSANPTSPGTLTPNINSCAEEICGLYSGEAIPRNDVTVNGLLSLGYNFTACAFNHFGPSVPTTCPPPPQLNYATFICVLRREDGTFYPPNCYYGDIGTGEGGTCKNLIASFVTLGISAADESLR